MQPIGIEEVKRISAKFGRRNQTQLRIPPTSAALTKTQRRIQELLQSHLETAAFPTEQLNKLTAKAQAERRNLFDARVAERAKNASADNIAFRQGLDNLRQAQGLLAKPYQSQLIALDQPSLIEEYPDQNFGIWIDWAIDPNNSFIKVKIDTNSGSYSTTFAFHFYWTNPSLYYAVVNAGTSLIFNGICEVEGAQGIFSGDSGSLTVEAELEVWRWSGWGTDPVTGQSNDQTLLPLYQPGQAQYVAMLSASGGGAFGDVGFITQEFHYQPVVLRRDLIAIPPNAMTLFKVDVHFTYTMDGNNIADLIFADFADDQTGNIIICPAVVLELLTPEPGASE
jgi:hypothetical protein